MCCSFYVYMTLIYGSPLKQGKLWRVYIVKRGYITLPGIVGTAMLSVSAAEMILGTVVRMSVLYARKGPGPWMAAALWSTAFQVVIMPYRWALEWGRDQGEAITRVMEDKVGGANLPLDGGGTSTININGRN